MYYNYEVRNNGFEDILYLYLTMKYEFSKELTNSKDIGRRTKNFIQNNNIPFKGNKVYLIVDGIIVKVLDLSLENNTTNYKLSNEYTINILLEDNSLCEISLREYLLSILLSYQDNEIEVLKALCILFTTYAFKMMKDNNYLNSNNEFASYKPLKYYKKLSNYNTIIEQLNNIIDSVNGIYIAYKDDYILPFIHYSNNGKTKTNSKYPYLSAVKSLWDLSSPKYLEITNISYQELSDKLKININNTTNIEMYKKDSTITIKFNDKIYNIEEIKELFNLKSSEIYILTYPNYLKFITIGYGHSYGLSIYGATEIAKNGGKYYDILKYYFPKTNLYQKRNELS